MSLPPRVVLHSPVADKAALETFVEQCLRDGVRLISIVGEGADALEEEVDWLVIGDGAVRTTAAALLALMEANGDFAG